MSLYYFVFTSALLVLYTFSHTLSVINQSEPPLACCGGRTEPYCEGRSSTEGGATPGRDAQPGALVIGRHYVTERDSAPVQYNGIV